MRSPLAFLLSALIFLSCQSIPPHVKAVLEIAGSNRSELEKVLVHFKSDPEKLRAAYFLIGNMKGHFTYGGETVEHFDGIFRVLDSLHRHGVKVPITSPILKLAWDSLVNLYGNHPTLQEAELMPDYLALSSSFLIAHIDSSFKTWKESRWCKQLSFAQFCEYLLPYRTAHEKPELFHTVLRRRFAMLRDTSRAKNSYDFTEQFNKQLRAFASTNNTMRLYPFDMSVSQMEKGRRGSCAHLSQYTALALRANGVPAAVDYTPMWGDLDRGHQWVVLLQENGKCFAFDAGAAVFGGVYNFPYRFCKVYRKTFAAQDNETSAARSQAPEHLFDNNRQDVTEEYTKVSDLDIPLTKNFEIPREYAVICTYRTFNWAAQAYAPIKNKKARFNKMGRNLLYIVMYYYQGDYYPATNPFILREDGSIHYLQQASGKQSMQLLRKYPCFPRTRQYMSDMVGGRFQGANKADFSDSVNLFTVKDIPVKLETALIDAPGAFRYVRFIAPHGIRTNVAEVLFFDQRDNLLHGKVIGFPDVSDEETGTGLRNVFDGQLETYFSGISQGISWAGLDLGKPQRIKRIRYCPRSDTNFILEGDTYELLYWDGEKWLKTNRQVATEQSLLFSDLPAGTVYKLHNLSRGDEERIFTYENGQQVWW